MKTRLAIAGACLVASLTSAVAQNSSFDRPNISGSGTTYHSGDPRPAQAPAPAPQPQAAPMPSSGQLYQSSHQYGSGTYNVNQGQQH